MGAVVAFRERDGLGFGTVAGEERRGRIPLIPPRGREELVAESRILVEVAAPEPGSPAERAAACEARVRSAVRQVDVPALWEVAGAECAESAESGGTLSTDELAGLALGAADGPARAALTLALLEDGIHFVLKGEAWAPRRREAVAEIRHERRQVARREAEKQAFLGGVAGAARGELRLAESETAKRYLDALEQLAAHEDGAPPATRRLAAEALAASGLAWERPHEGAFRLLVRLGRFSADANLQVVRFGLRTEFPPGVLQAAQAAAARGFDRADRRDLTGLAAVSIDGPYTLEIDDLLAAAPLPGGGCSLAVHIADPAAFVACGDPVDAEALARGLTYYMPDLRLPMLPEALAEQAASLVAGEERPALSFLVDLDSAGGITAHEIVRSVVRSAARLSYDEADRAIATGVGPHAELLRRLAAVGEAREQLRTAAGAITIRAPEVDLHVHADGEIRLERLEADSPARRAVSEAMILVGELTARTCRAASIPAIYRRQTIAEPLQFGAGAGSDPVLRRRLRRAFKRAETGLEPGPHDSLGLEAYAQASSPLRRYQDLATHRQLAAHLAGSPPPYDREGLQRIAATTEQAEADARRAEDAADDYWMLRYLEGQRGRELDAVVVEVEPRTVVQLVETLREQPLPTLTGVEPGQAVRVRVEKVNPRAGLLVLVPVAGGS